MSMKNPPHPGLSVRHDCLEPLGLSVTEAAKKLSVSRKQLSDVLNGHSGISPEMAIRLDMAFGGGADTWLRLQDALPVNADSGAVSITGPVRRAHGTRRERNGQFPTRPSRILWPPIRSDRGSCRSPDRRRNVPCLFCCPVDGPRSRARVKVPAAAFFPSRGAPPRW